MDAPQGSPEGQPEQATLDRDYPLAFRKWEAAWVRQRRKEPDKEEGGGTEDASLPGDTFGVALSGGGIRSATFCLGFFQALAKAGLLKKVDFLSTVSGGGYFGGFLGRWFMRTGASAAIPAPTDPIRGLASPTADPVRFLRDNGRYLSPNGAGDSLLAAAIALRNVVAIHVVLGMTALTLFFLANFLRGAMGASAWAWMRDLLSAAEFTVHRQDWLWWSPYLWLPLGTFLFLVVPFGWAYWFTTSHRTPEQSGRGESHSGRPKDFPAWLTGLAVAVVGLSLFGLWVLQHASSHQGLFIKLFRLAVASVHPYVYGVFDKIPDQLFSAIDQYGGWAGWVGLDAVLALGCWGWAEVRAARPEKARDRQKSSGPLWGAYRTRRVRNLLSHWLEGAFALTLALLGFALVDSFGQTLYALSSTGGLHNPFARLLYLPLAGGVALLAAAGKWLLPLLERLPSKRRFTIPLEALAAVAAIGLALAEGSILCGIAHGVGWHWGTPAGDPGALLRWSQATPAVALSIDRHIVVNPCPPGAPEVLPLSPEAIADLFLAFLVSLLLAWAFSRTIQFLNLSSHHTLYRARLTRAYLGASNPERQEEEKRKVTEDLPGDNLSMEDYRPHSRGGPLHLINVTLNETVEGRSQLQQQDRKGLPMAVGPCGISIGKRFHTLWGSLPAAPPKEGSKTLDPPLNTSVVRPVTQADLAREKVKPFHPFEGVKSHKDLEQFPVEDLDLGSWVAISGAAVNTGMGSQTGLGFSLLLGLLNVRTGYWWDSGVDPLKRRAGVPLGKVGAWLCRILPVPCYLGAELLGRFHGLARQKWNLSDGGHFENTAVYELLRRRIPNILVCDCGADPSYQFGDLANLIRIARTDFGAEITRIEKVTAEHWKKWNGPCIDPSAVGTLRDLEENRAAWAKGEPLPHPGIHAAMAEVRYAKEEASNDRHACASCGLLLLAKPSLAGDEPEDIIHYGKEHEAFPQEPTLDQYYDEAQWESYRKIGEHVGQRLLLPSEKNPEINQGNQAG